MIVQAHAMDESKSIVMFFDKICYGGIILLVVDVERNQANIVY
jgi:hypothetical protein